MTVAGFHVVAVDRAVAWCDTQLFAPDGAPTAHRSKMAINATCGVVGAGTGFVATLATAEEVIAGALSFDDVLCKMPGRLAQTARELEAHQIAARSTSSWQRYCICGFSHRMNRILGCVFSGEAEFAATMTSCFAAPAVDGIRDGADAIIDVAQRQTLTLQRANPRAGRGVLVYAEVTPASITCGPIFDLGRGRGLSHFVDPSTLAPGDLVPELGPVAGDPE